MIQKSVLRFIVPLMTATLVSSCAATPVRKRPPVQAPPNAEKEFRAAESIAQDGKVRGKDANKAMARLKKIAQQNPDSEIEAGSRLLMGKIHFNAQRYNEAVNEFQAILASETESKYEPEAGLLAIRALLRLGRAPEAEAVLSRSARWQNLDQAQSLELQKARYDVYSKTGRNPETIQAILALGKNHPDSTERERFKAIGKDFVESRLNEDEVRTLGGSDKYDFLQVPAKFRYALMMLEQKQFSSARRYFAEVAELAPGSEQATRANAYVQQLDSRNKVDSRVIGAVLPLSGKQAAIGYKALKAIQLGLGIYGSQSRSGFKLSVIDSEGNPDAARRAIERLVTEDNAIAIIGGLLSRTASTEAAKAQEFGVPIIALSQKTGVTEAGDSVFRNALTGQMQVQYLVETAMGKLGHKNFAIIYPNDPYGVEYANLFWDEVKSRGGNITGAQTYDPKETDFRGHIQRLVGTYYLEDRADEYRLRVKAWQEKNPRLSGRQSFPQIEDLLPPIVDFDAVFIPDSAKAVGQIAPMLAYNNVNKVRLLGTNLWNSSSLLSRGQKFVENSIFVDSFLSSDPSFKNSEFYQTFQQTYDEEPGLTEVQAYDSALILRQLIGQGESSRLGLQRKLASLSNFPGVLGKLSTTPAREVRRPLTALTVKDGRILNTEETAR